MNNILINGRFLGNAMTGVERYAFEMLHAIDALIDESHPSTEGASFYLALPKHVHAPVPYRHIAPLRRGYLRGHAWEQIDLALFPRKDITINLCNFGSLARPDNVSCVHDAHVWLIPNNFSLAFRLLYRLLLPLSLRRSRRWVTVSDYSARQLLRFGIADRAPDAITPNGSDHALRWDQRRSTLRIEDLPERFIFALGSRSINKNMGLIYRLASELRPKGISVLIAGGNNSKIFRNDATESCDNVTVLGRVSDDDLALLMAKAICLVFPSLFEGFGVPPLEAMRVGCPVVASNTSAMPEVLRTAALLCDPGDLDQWIAAVLQLSMQPDVRADLVERGLERAAAYTWRTSALKLLEVVQREAPRDVEP